MDPTRAAEELKVIRALMERPVRYSSMSGMAGIVAGCIALAGLGANELIVYHLGPVSSAVWINFAACAVLLLVAVGGVLGLTRWREVRQGMPFWTPIKRKILHTILPIYVAGMTLSGIVLHLATFAPSARSGGMLNPQAIPEMLSLVPAIWMIFYGLGCWQVGEYSIIELRAMALAFVAAGLCTAALPFWLSEILLGASFGGFHIIYGIIVWIRHGG